MAAQTAIVSFMQTILEAVEKVEETKRALEKLGEYENANNKEFTEPERVEEIESNQASGKYCLILDSACSSTLCGQKWLDSYLDYLGEMKNEVEYKASEKSFIFGGGKPVKSTSCCRLPAVLAGKMIEIDVDVVPNDLPLIFSLGDMKKAQLKLDFTSDTAEIFGEVIKLKITESGHYSVPIDGKKLWRRRPLRQLSQ